MSTSVALENITISYDRHPAVHHISGKFAVGSLTAITGPNGAGKSTLLKGIAGILKPEAGRITFDGVNKRRIAYLPQAAEVQRDFPLSVLDMAASGFWHDTGGFTRITRPMKETAAKALDTVGLSGLGVRPLSHLSAGQFQRALFARTIVQDAPLILLDEPFAAIDTDTSDHLLGIIRKWNEEGRTVICVLHDLPQIRQYFPQTLLLARECIAWEETPSALNPQNLSRARFLREGWDSPDQVCERVA
jgi:zinc/manganese transport system ATP-binding protein